MTDTQTQISRAWGAPPSARYEALVEKFRPLFAEIAEGAVRRDLERELPYREIDALKAKGFGAFRIPVEYGGAGANLPELFNLLIELSEADSNFTQALRSHVGFVEDVLNSKTPGRRERWAPRIAAGEIAGNAWTEIGEAKIGGFSTRVTRQEDGWRLTGKKFYTTGSLFAEWIYVGAADEKGEPVFALAPRSAEGVSVLDDWGGFGQIVTASGTAIFENVRIAKEDVYPEKDGAKYGAAFYQLVHLATLAGVGRAIARDVSLAVAKRTRTYTHAAAPRSAQDPQVLQVVGRIRSAAYSAGAIVLKAAEALQRAYDAGQSGDAAADEAANAVAELEVAQSQTIVSNLVLDAATVAFDALGASATLRTAGLDRHWRNARTLSSHNPRIYKDRIVGDYAVNQTPPPYQWRIGEP